MSLWGWVNVVNVGYGGMCVVGLVGRVLGMRAAPLTPATVLQMTTHKEKYWHCRPIVM